MLTYYLLGGIGKYKPSIYLARIPISHNEIGSLILDKIMKHKGKSMMKDFFALLDKLNESDRKQVEGYSLAEIKRIEKLYDITIQGDFLEFMLRMGRCSGGLFGDDPIVLYKEQRSVRSQILFQLINLDFLHDHHYEMRAQQPFCFSWESETQYLFILTQSEDQLVYGYDEYEEAIYETGKTFEEYMFAVYEYYEHYFIDDDGKRIVCKGELLVF